MSDTKNKSKYDKIGSYVRPALTITDQLTPEEVATMLKDYKKINTIEELAQVSLGTHIRYFSIDPETQKPSFRLGGSLFKSNTPTYIMLKSSIEGTKPWSVQVKNAVFYRKLTEKEIIENYEKLLSNSSDAIKNLKKENKQLKAVLEEVEEEIPIVKPRKSTTRTTK